jgi:hypothetical protein
MDHWFNRVRNMVEISINYFYLSSHGCKTDRQGFTVGEVRVGEFTVGEFRVCEFRVEGLKWWILTSNFISNIVAVLYTCFAAHPSQEVGV